MLVFALILLFFANHQSPDVLTETFGAEAAQNGNMLGDLRARASSCRSSSCTASTPPGRSARRRSTRAARRRAACCRRSSSRVRSGSSSCWRSSCRSRTSRPRWPPVWPASSRSRRRSRRNLDSEIVGGITVGEIYLFVILASVFVCTLAIQGAATRMMFSMGRDRNLPLGSRAWGHVSTRFRTPANAAIAVGVLAAIPILLVGPIGGITLSIAATGLIYLSYFLCNLGVARRALARLAAPDGLVQPRPMGHADQHPGAHLGRDHAHQHRPVGVAGAVRRLRRVRVAATGTRSSTGCSRSAARSSKGLPAWPLFETLVGLLLVIGAIYYVVAVRGRARRDRGRRGDR